MRSILLMVLCCLMSSSLYAQKKPKISQAEKALSAGDYATARDIVDQAPEFDKLKDDPKTWFLRARVYMAIDTSGTNIVDNPMAEAMASFDKAKGMEGFEKLSTPDPAGGFLPIFFDQHITNYWAYYYNQGAAAYGEEDYENAVAGFEKAQAILPSDTNAYINAGLAAHNGELWDAAMRSYQGALDNGVTSKDIFALYNSILTTEKKDYDKALEITRKAREIYPDDKELARSEINILIQADKVDEAKANLEKQLEEDPDNANYHFIYGVLLEESGDKDGAKQAYQNAIKADEEHFNSNFNLGVILINEATDIIKERNNLGISDADLKKAEEMDPMIDDKLRSAIPQWERVHSLDGSDETAMTTLRYIYTQLKQFDKAEAMQAKIDAAGVEN